MVVQKRYLLKPIILLNILTANYCAKLCLQLLCGKKVLLFSQFNKYVCISLAAVPNALCLNMIYGLQLPSGEFHGVFFLFNLISGCLRRLCLKIWCSENNIYST